MKSINRQDKYKAIWLSHSSISDFEKCPRLYYLHNIYKNERGRKINITSPYMTLGIAVHNIIEDLKNYKVAERESILEEKDLLGENKLINDYNNEWQKYVGEVGGFDNLDQELEFKKRGESMIRKIISDPKILLNKTIGQKSYYDGDMLPNYYISQEENIILCGNLDWIEYNDTDNTLTVVDFKTGKNEEKENSIQLPIYKLLLENLQSKWRVKNGKYWYFEDETIKVKEFDNNLIEEIKNKIINIGVNIRDRKYSWSQNAKYGKPGWVEIENYQDNFKCTNSDLENNSDNRYCDCQKYEKILDGKAKYITVDMYGKDLYKV